MLELLGLALVAADFYSKHSGGDQARKPAGFIPSGYIEFCPAIKFLNQLVVVFEFFGLLRGGGIVAFWVIADGV